MEIVSRSAIGFSIWLLAFPLYEFRSVTNLGRGFVCFLLIGLEARSFIGVDDNKHSHRAVQVGNFDRQWGHSHRVTEPLAGSSNNHTSDNGIGTVPGGGNQGKKFA